MATAVKLQQMSLYIKAEAILNQFFRDVFQDALINFDNYATNTADQVMVVSTIH